MAEMTEVTKDKLIADVKLVIADSEELLRATAGQAGEKIAEIRARTADRLATAKIKLAEAEAGDRREGSGVAGDLRGYRRRRAPHQPASLPLGRQARSAGPGDG